jgi:stalled ribosome rescue protein Dom34
VYKINDIKTAVESGAIDMLLVSEKKIKEKLVEEIAKNVEMKAGEVYIISPEHNLGEQFDRFGGLGGIMRFKLFN